MKLVDEYISQYYHPGTRKSNNKIPIKNAMNLSLHIIPFTITWVVGSTCPHLTSQDYIHYSLQHLNLTIFDWIKGLLVNLKEQLT